MKKKTLLAMAEDIARGLVLDMQRPRGEEMSADTNMVDILLQPLAENVAELLRDVGTSNGASNEKLVARLVRAERGLSKLAAGSNGDGDDEDEVSGNGSRLPNLKYAKPKYKNVESILKFVERDEDKGGVKLVIMNFND